MQRNLTRYYPWLVGVVLVAAAALPYGGVLNAPFVFDDIKLVRDNAFLRGAIEEPSAVIETFDITSNRWADEELRPNYRPLRFLSYFVDYWLTVSWYGKAAAEDLPTFFFHFTNVLFHVLNALLVFALARVLLTDCSQGETVSGAKKRAPSPAILFGATAAGVLFALHPLQTEAVTYISGRRDVLSTSLFLGALLLSVRALPTRPVGWLALFAAPLLFVGGMLTKEMVITLAPLLAVVDWLRGAKPLRRRVALHSALWVLTAAFIVLTLNNRALIASAALGESESAFWTASRYVARYLGLLAFPVGQSIDYSFAALTPSTGPTSPWTTLPAAALTLAMVLVGVGCCAVGRVSFTPRRTRGRPWGIVALGLLWFLGVLVPVLQFVPIPERFAERYAYLPGIGLFLLLGGGLAVLWRRERTVALVFACFVSVVLATATVRRNQAWTSPLSLWTSAVESQPRAARAHVGRAHALKVAGRRREAVREYSVALEIFRERPDAPLHHGYILQALTFRAELYASLADDDAALLDRAAEDYALVLSLKDTDGVTIAGSAKHTAIHFNYASVLLRRGDLAAADAEYDRVIAIGTPANLVGSAHYYLGKIYLAQSQEREALQSFRRAFDELPGAARETHRVAAELVDLLIARGDLADADTLIQAALDRGADGKEKLHLLLRRAKILDRQGELAMSIDVLETIRRQDDTYLPALISLAGIKTNQGEFEASAELLQHALQLSPGHTEALQALRRLEVQRRMSATGGGEDGNTDGGDQEQETMLRGIAEKGAQHVGRLELKAAQQVYTELLRRAETLENLHYQTKALVGIATVQSRLGLWDRCREAAERAHRLAPRASEPLRLLADSYFVTAVEDERSRGYYLRFVETVGEEPVPAYALARLAALSVASDATQAEEFLRRAIERKYAGPEVAYARGFLHALRKDWASALDAFNEYLDAAPRSEVARSEQVRKYVDENVVPHLLSE